MLKAIKRYDMSDVVDLKVLINSGFKAVEPSVYCYHCVLYDDIELFVRFYIQDDGSLLFDDYSNVQVIDDNYGQYYTPFYESKKPFHFLNIIIFKYNEAMDSLVLQGVLKPKMIIGELEELPPKRTLKKD